MDAPSDEPIRARIRGDLPRHTNGSWAKALVRAATLDAIGAVLLFRLSQALYRRGHHATAWALSKIIFMIYGAELHPAADIGRGFGMAHTSGVTIGGGAVAGHTLTVFGKVTIGSGGQRQWPVLGDDVILYTGCCVIGGVAVGDKARVGANSVVVADVPAGRLAFGVPAQITPRRDVAGDVGS